MVSSTEANGEITEQLLQNTLLFQGVCRKKVSRRYDFFVLSPSLCPKMYRNFEAFGKISHLCTDYFPNFLFTYKSIRNDMSVQFFICHIDSHLDTVQDLNSGNIHLDQVLLLPSRLTKQLEELALFLGRVSCLSSSFTRTSPVSVGTSLRLTAGSHLFHLHLELNWAAIETLCLLLEKQGKYIIYKKFRASAVRRHFPIRLRR